MLYAVIQNGFSASGIGKTRDEAIRNAAQTYETDNGDDAETALRYRIENAQPRIHGEFYVIDITSEEWNDYVYGLSMHYCGSCKRFLPADFVIAKTICGYCNSATVNRNLPA